MYIHCVYTFTKCGLLHKNLINVVYTYTYPPRHAHTHSAWTPPKTETQGGVEKRNHFFISRESEEETHLPSMRDSSGSSLSSEVLIFFSVLIHFFLILTNGMNVFSCSEICVCQVSEYTSGSISSSAYITHDMNVSSSS